MVASIADPLTDTTVSVRETTGMSEAPQARAAGATPVPSARQRQLFERAYQHVLRHGLADMSLRPLAQAIGSSPRVLLFLFGSKDGLVRALLERARADERTLALAVLRGAMLDLLATGDARRTSAAVRRLLEPTPPSSAPIGA